jgi:hypothetical protein
MNMADTIKNTGHLLVLVPDEELDEGRYARKARSIAESQNLAILFIGLTQSPESEAQMRRKLVTLSGIANSDSVKSDFMIHESSSWFNAVQQECDQQDFVLCPAELNTNSSLLGGTLDLRTELAGKIYFVPGMMPSSRQERLEKITREVLNWGGILVILTVGFLLEVDFDRQTIGIAKTISEVVILAAEIGILWWWNTFVNRLNY